MYKLIAVTDRALCIDDFAGRIKNIAECGIDVILRAKDMDENSYKALLKQVGMKHIIPHSFADAAAELGYKRIHMPLQKLTEQPSLTDHFDVSVSIHSLKQLKVAEALGACAVTAGHVFETACKDGLPGRGLNFIRKIKAYSSVPVYAIGGISPENAASVIEAGADGVCVMSGFMRCGDISEYLRKFKLH